MRTTQQVLDQILAFARASEKIRAVAMNGSRVNPNAPKDFFQDYDVVFYVENPRDFLADQSWIRHFGELVILQQNDFSNDGIDGYIFLMLFTDGVRIDLSFDGLPGLAHIAEDTLTTVLLDKDGRIPPLPPASDAGYIVRKPERKEFDETVNEIFWCSNNIAKGIWRDELPYARYMFDTIVREPVVKLLTWYAAMRHGWAICTGSYGKWLKRFLPAEIYADYCRTYAGPGYAETWDALFTALDLVGRIGPELAEHLGYAYPHEDARRVLAYLRRVRALPPDAVSFDGR